jgi:hypothetical protein
MKAAVHWPIELQAASSAPTILAVHHRGERVVQALDNEKQVVLQAQQVAKKDRRRAAPGPHSTT